MCLPVLYVISAIRHLIGAIDSETSSHYYRATSYFPQNISQLNLRNIRVHPCLSAVRFRRLRGPSPLRVFVFRPLAASPRAVARFPVVVNLLNLYCYPQSCRFLCSANFPPATSAPPHLRASACPPPRAPRVKSAPSRAGDCLSLP